LVWVQYTKEQGTLSIKIDHKIWVIPPHPFDASPAPGLGSQVKANAERDFILASIMRISCQDVLLQKGFDLNNKPKSPVRYVCYALKCCMEARFSKM
jgi:hypothetical protein